MKIAIAASEPGLDSPVTAVFGRAPYFVIVETDGNDVKLVENIQNPAVYEARGAGILAAQTVAGKKVNALVAGSMGPNAYTILSQAGIRMLMAIPGTVRDNAIAAAEGRLTPITAPRGRYGRGGGFGRGPGRGYGRGREW